MWFSPINGTATQNVHTRRSTGLVLNQSTKILLAARLRVNRQLDEPLDALKAGQTGKSDMQVR
jgi:hypothetical protein